ncbi:DUF3825 domain-containing protein [Komarekiella sp. 'clone 1']|uniref:DUF3825 domain-containing protein n=1 Tax=Komarekiella delphini-convector SJRDD-AB1 TaxID=2593771 RepID=A0AA40SVZ0_9NOST|nr:DUF3825 domain-containing protein [Komarekiella delphini-convector]MBD6616308.1 DUF3825 domain-containing protein [Komarekiella delphini-convector SJRDD-AB1]
MPSKEDLLEQYGSVRTSHVLEQLYNFAFITPTAIDNLNRQALDEDWGRDLNVLKKYIAITLYWSIEQGRFIEVTGGFIVTAGLLRNRYSVPIYLKFEQNTRSSNQPWALTFAGLGHDIDGVSEFPAAPEVPKSPEIPIGNEIVVKDEHILGERSERVPFLQGIGNVAQICALTGAIQWSIYRGLQQPCWYFGKVQYYVPIYLQNQENITATPDLVVPIEIGQDNLPIFVRTALNPESQTNYYSNIRPVVARADQLKPWVVSSWATKVVSSDEVE